MLSFLSRVIYCVPVLCKMLGPLLIRIYRSLVGNISSLFGGRIIMSHSGGNMLIRW